MIENITGETPFTIISTILAIITSLIAVYQFAVIRESNRRKNEIQHLLAGISSLILQKQTTWQNQLGFILEPKTELELDYLKTHVRVRDDMQELASLTMALEGSIDSKKSAIQELLQKGIEVNELNNKMQEITLKNKQPDNKSNV